MYDILTMSRGFPEIIDGITKNVLASLEMLQDHFGAYTNSNVSIF